MIYTDGKHLISSESIDELNNFADKIGLKREWIQNHRIIHYDLFGGKSLRALQEGAKKVSTVDLIHAYRKQPPEWWKYYKEANPSDKDEYDPQKHCCERFWKDWCNCMK